MMQAIILLLILSWLAGFVGIPFFHYILISPFTLQHVILLILMGLMTNLLPRNYRKAGMVLIVLWIVSLFGFVSLPAIGNLLVLTFILLSIFSIF